MNNKIKDKKQEKKILTWVCLYRLWHRWIPKKSEKLKNFLDPINNYIVGKHF
jgi:hypothetical protein